MYVCMYVCRKTVYFYIPNFGHVKHCPDEANDLPDNSEQQWS